MSKAINRKLRFDNLRAELAQARQQIEELKRERDEQKIPKELKRYDFADCVDRCPECDGQSFISAGGMNYVCHICFLLLENDKLEKQLAQAQKERDGWKDIAADAQMLAHQWMRRHDMIVAGVDSKTINCPKPADLPDAVAQARREGMEEAAKQMEPWLRHNKGCESLKEKRIDIGRGCYKWENAGLECTCGLAAAIRRANSGVSLSRGGNSGASGLVWPEQRAAEEK